MLAQITAEGDPFHGTQLHCRYEAGDNNCQSHWQPIGAPDAATAGELGLLSQRDTVCNSSWHHCLTLCSSAPIDRYESSRGSML